MAIVALTAVINLTACSSGAHDNPGAIFSCRQYTLYADSLVADSSWVKAGADHTLDICYSFTDTLVADSLLRFRLSFDGRDNEFNLGECHAVAPGLPDSIAMVTIGEPSSAYATSPRAIGAGSYTWNVAVDMRPMLRAFSHDDRYVTPTGDTIYRRDFSGVWIAGNDYPLSADFRSLPTRNDMMLRDRGDSIYKATVKVPRFRLVEMRDTLRVTDADTAMLRFKAEGSHLLTNTYAIASQRLHANARRIARRAKAPSTTAVSRAVAMSLAMSDAETSMKLLRRCVKGGRIVSGTGYGGAWPLSADRLMWIVAAQRVYDFSGSEKWLREATEIAVRTLADDIYVLSLPGSPLLRGRGTYEPYANRYADFTQNALSAFEYCSSEVNLLYLEALKAVAKMAHDAEMTLPDFFPEPDRVAEAINLMFWQPQSGWYTAGCMGAPYPVAMPQTGLSSSALAVLADVATLEMAQTIFNRTPRSVYGAPALWPVSDLRSNMGLENVVMPHTQTLWAIAAAKTGRADALEASIASLLRTYFFAYGTIGVNASTGVPVSPQFSPFDADETKLMTDAALTSAVIRALCGVDTYGNGRIGIRPFMLSKFASRLSLNGLRHRNALIDLEITGNGSKILSTALDGVQCRADKVLSDTLSGRHKLTIVMSGNENEKLTVPLSAPRLLPSTPDIIWHDGRLATMVNYTSGQKLQVIIDGVIREDISRADYRFPFSRHLMQAQFALSTSKGLVSAPTAPHYLFPAGTTRLPASLMGLTGTSLPIRSGNPDNLVEINPLRNRSLNLDIHATRGGHYFLSLIYANGSGQADTQTRAVLRSVSVNGSFAGVIVMPCIGEGDWTHTSRSSFVPVVLRRGSNRININFIAPYCLNAAGSPGTALLHSVTLTPQ